MLRPGTSRRPSSGSPPSWSRRAFWSRTARGPRSASGPVDEPVGRTPFVDPALEKYTDMQDFLLVDPIHEVSDAGWPHTQPPG